MGYKLDIKNYNIKKNPNIWHAIFNVKSRFENVRSFVHVSKIGDFARSRGRTGPIQPYDTSFFRSMSQEHNDTFDVSIPLIPDF